MWFKYCLRIQSCPWYNCLRSGARSPTAPNSSSVCTKVVLCARGNCIKLASKIDDGFTGVNFNRPAFNRMLRDLKLGKINCVMVKNLDRFGRGAKTGVYIEEHFVEPQVRFIALGENVDTATNSDELIDFYLTFGTCEILPNELNRFNCNRLDFINCNSINVN